MSILMSIKPEFCHLIAAGEKTIEVRKTLPNKLKPPYKIYIYCTQGDKIFSQRKEYGETSLLYDNRELYKNQLERKGYTILNGKVIGEFVCDKEYPVAYYLDDGRLVYNESILKETCLTKTEIANYANGKDADGLHISELVIYDKPKELSEFYKPYPKCTGDCYDCSEWVEDYIRHGWETDVEYHGHCLHEEENHGVKRPPQSWCYAEAD